MHSRRAFTLIEVIIAIAVLGIALVAAIQIAISSNRLASNLMHRFTAHHLAEEGIEIVRTLRDTNWMKNLDWRTQLDDGNFVVVARADILDTPTAKEHPLFLLKESTDSIGGLALQTGEDVSFYRRIEISTPDPAKKIMRVKSSVTYIFRGLKHSLAVQTELTDWKKGPL